MCTHVDYFLKECFYHFWDNFKLGKSMEYYNFPPPERSSSNDTKWGGKEYKLMYILNLTVLNMILWQDMTEK